MLREPRGGSSDPRRFVRRLTSGFGVVAATILGMGACSTSSTDSSGSGGGGCETNRTFFEEQVWSSFMSTTCFKCHGPGGLAVNKGARFQLMPSAYPNFIDVNLANLTMISKTDYEGTSELLLKPIGQDNHLGGVVIQKDSTQYKALEELVKRLKSNDDSCVEPPNLTIQKAKLMDPPSTLRKAALDLAGRLPTAAETEAVTKGGEKALDAAIDTLLTEDIFYTRLREIWNDLLLTDKFLEYNGAAIGFMNTDEYPALAPYQNSQDPKYQGTTHDLINQAIAQEPLNLIDYVVRNEKPFSDIAAGEYTVVNPYLATAYGVKIAFKDPTDYNEWHEAKVHLGTGYNVPHAGILSTPVFLNRWTTTPTNRDRGRARRVFQFLLATDILQIATRPVDATTVTQIENPTENSDICTVCHHIIDPVAGGFRGYDDNDYELFNPDDPWHDDMFAPGYGTTLMDASYYTRALQWLGSQVAADSRFATNAVYSTYTGLTGNPPIPYPVDATDPNFKELLAAWAAQDAFFRGVVTSFTESKMNLKVVVKAIVESPYYRGVAAGSGSKYDDPTTLTDVGTARLLTPEMLTRKLTAILGFTWSASYDVTHDYLLNDYLVTYGGIDSDSVTARLTSPNGIMFAVQERMASEMGCRATAFDFTNPAASRNLFPNVELTEVPESAGNAVAGSVDDIKTNIVHLHQLLLGETLAKTDPEVERTYQVFLDTWHEMSESGSPDVVYDCQGKTNWITGQDVPDAQQVTSDPNYTLRSWQAVITYLLSDYSFLYE